MRKESIGMVIESNKDILNITDLNYFDVFAMLCFRIDSLDENIREKLFDAVDSDLDTYILRARKLFPWISLKGKTSIPTYHDIDGCDVDELLEFSKGNELDDLGTILGLISLLDSTMDLSINFKSFIADKKCRVVSEDDDYLSDSFYAFDALNYNTKDDFGLVLPCVFCEWEKHSDRSLETVAFMPLALVLKNYLWVPSNSDWKVKNLFTDMKSVGIGSELISDMPPLKIISSPITNRSPFYAELNKVDREFYIHYQDIYNEIMLSRMKKVIEYSIRECADIVVFPEMMGTEYCISSCKDYIGGVASIKRPKLYILPSREYCKDGQWYNTVDILDEEGDCIFKYNKQHPFLYDHKESGKKKVTYKEPIVPDNNVCVIHVSGIGRIGIIICSDIFKDGYLQWLINNFKLTLLLYPVYSHGKDLLVRNLSIAHTFSCDVLMCNTCAAWENFLIPPADRPNNDNFDSTFINMYYPYGHLPSKGGLQTMICDKNECKGCVFVTSICKNYRCDTCLIEQIGLEGK